MPVSDKEVDVEDADSLYVETIDLGEASPRTVIFGLLKHVSLEQHHQVMCASSLDKVEIMEVDKSCIPGDIVDMETSLVLLMLFSIPKKGLGSSFRSLLQVSVDLRVSQEGLAVYKDQVLTVRQKPMTAPTLRNVPMK
uniref:Uncharacterized protein n=1 Tax=Ditylenchus dipsaci TaxID=166011 RepID=A0A915DDV8_9BILA